MAQLKITNEGMVLQGSDKVTTWDQLSPGVYATAAAGPLTAAYVREKDGPAIQKSVNHAVVAAEDAGRTLDAIYLDTTTASTPMSARPGGAALLEATAAGKVDQLIVSGRTRLSRNPEDYLQVYGHLQRHGIEVKFTDPNETAIGKGPHGPILMNWPD